MRKITGKGRIRHLMALTAGLLAAGVVIAPQALADPGNVGDASLWRTSPKCSQPEDIILAAQGSGVLEFEYRVIGGEPTTHKSRPQAQPHPPRRVETAIPEGQVVWRVVAYDTNLPNSADRRGDISPIDPTAPPSSAVEASCGQDAAPPAGRGDRTISSTSHEAWLATDQCSQANGNFVPVGGAPQQPAELIVRVSAGGEGNCKARIRMLYVPNWNDEPIMTPYVEQERSAEEEVLVVPAGLRCHVDLGVRRDDGTYYTHRLDSDNPPPSCPV